MRVLVLIDGFRLGGAGTLLIPFAGAAREAWVEVNLMSVSPMEVAALGVLEQYRAAGLTVRSAGIGRLLDPAAIPRMVRVNRAERNPTHVVILIATVQQPREMRHRPDRKGKFPPAPPPRGPHTAGFHSALQADSSPQRTFLAIRFRDERCYKLY